MKHPSLYLGALGLLTSLSFNAVANNTTVDENGIAHCPNDYSASSVASRGEMTTDKAQEIIDNAPKASIEMLPNQEIVSPLTTCYFGSFNKAGQNGFYHIPRWDSNVVSEQTEENRSVSQGWIRYSVKDFQKIQGAMLHACQNKFGLN